MMRHKGNKIWQDEREGLIGDPWKTTWNVLALVLYVVVQFVLSHAS